VRKFRNRLRLALEPGQAVDILRDILMQHLDRHIAIQPLIVRAVNLPHPALTDLLDDAVVTEGATNEATHC